MAGLDLKNATSLLNSAAPQGDFDADGDVDTNDLNVWPAKFGTSTILHGSSADFNYDGAIDLSAYVLWRKYFDASAGSGGLSIPSVPEPTSGALVGIASIVLCCKVARRKRGK